jgi:ion channel-forming bestrophin family protein
MIVRPRPGILGLLYIFRGSVVPRIAPQVLTISVIAGLVAWGARIRPDLVPAFPAAPFTLMGVALSIFIGFRNNACYDRWWEARKQWGALVMESRALARLSVTTLPDEVTRQRVLRRAIAFAHSLAGRLRGEASLEALRPWLPDAEWQALQGCRNAPSLILREMGADLAREMGHGRITDIVYQLFDARMTAMAGVQAACERIQGTPLPFAYTLLLHRTAYLVCLLLPFELVGSLGLITPLVTAVLAYAFFGLDALGDEIEEPFGLMENDLPLNALVRVIEIDVLEALDEPVLPQALRPERYVLM